MAHLEKDIQTIGFRSEAHRLRVNLLFTAGWLQDRVSGFLKQHGLTQPQFNALRILRGWEREARSRAEDGEYAATFSTSDLRARMLDRASDTPRLVQRLADRGLVHKKPCSRDGRRVNIRITPAGLDLLEKVDRRMNELDALTNSLTEPEMRSLNVLLDTLRG